MLPLLRLAALAALTACLRGSDVTVDTPPADDPHTDPADDTDVDVAPWAWCSPPTAAAVVVGPTVTAGARYCATFDERREDLAADRRQRAELRLHPGVLDLTGLEAATVQVPACVRTRTAEPANAPMDDASTPDLRDQWTPVGTASATVLRVGEGTRATYRVRVVQPMRSGAGTSGELRLDLDGLGEPEAQRIDGRHVSPATGSAVDWLLCQGACSSRDERWPFDSCSFEGLTGRVDRVPFDDGEVELEVVIGSSFTGTQPGLLRAVRGTLDGTPFDVRSYWDLAYLPGHHHIVRSAAAWFPAPIEGACGIAVRGVTDELDLDRARVQRLDCNDDPSTDDDDHHSDDDDDPSTDDESHDDDSEEHE